MSAHSWRSQGPAAEWMALSMQACSGWKHPRRAEFAALTIASARIVVMSPRHRDRRGVHLRSRQAEGVDGFSLGRLGGQEPLQ